MMLENIILELDRSLGAEPLTDGFTHSVEAELVDWIKEHGERFASHILEFIKSTSSRVLRGDVVVLLGRVKPSFPDKWYQDIIKTCFETREALMQYSILHAIDHWHCDPKLTKIVIDAMNDGIKLVDPKERWVIAYYDAITRALPPCF